MRIIFFLFLSLPITSCNNKLKEKIGLETKGPDEYKVQAVKPLEVPPHYNLPNPYILQQISNRQLTEDANTRAVTDGERALINDLSH